MAASTQGGQGVDIKKLAGWDKSQLAEVTELKLVTIPW